MVSNMLFQCDCQGHTIAVEAAYLPRPELWNMLCRIDGEGFEARQSDDPFHEARDMIACAVLEIEPATGGN